MTGGQLLRKLASTQEDALFDLLQGKTGEQFAGKNVGWSRDTPVCDWYGIVCDTEGNVLDIDLANAGLEGTIPKSLTIIESLAQLFLGGNRFSGSIPYDILTMPKLRTFDASYNNLTGILYFPITTSLQSFVVSHNNLTGDLPPQFHQGLTNLKIFDVKYNRFKGTLPALDSVDLPVLKTLDLSNNQFQGRFPTFLTSILSLENLYLSNNFLSGTIPPAFGNPDLSLREIFLHGNQLTGSLPSTLAELTRLRTLFIDDNELTGTVPVEICQMSLNEAFFHGNAVDLPDIDSTYSDLYGDDSGRKLTDQTRRLREGDPTSERDGCTSVACPPGFQSKGENNKDGVFPCEECDDETLNPFMGSNKCFDLNQDVILQRFYEATNGAAWWGAHNWDDSSVPTCQKEGVSCNNVGQVVGISLPNKGLSGTLPRELGFLDHLKSLDISGNQIGGRIPPDLRLTPLEKLELSGNQLTGMIPLGLCQKDGLNGNGDDGIFSCDVIACRAGSHSANGRAQPGASGQACKMCMASAEKYLGMINCVVDTSAITPFGALGEFAITVFGVTMICIVFWVWKRSSTSTEYIRDRTYAQTHGPPGSNISLSSNDTNFQDSVTDFSQPNSPMEVTDPLEGIDGIRPPPPIPTDNSVVSMESVDVQSQSQNQSQWPSDSHRDVWLDVPKIQ